MHQTLLGDKDSGASVTLVTDPAVSRQMLSAVRGSIQGALERHRFLISLPWMLQAPISSKMGSDVSVPPGFIQEKASEKGQLLSRLEEEIKYGKRFPVHITSPRSMERSKRPTSTEQNVPGYTIFGVFFIVLTLASGFIHEKRDGTFQRILTAPVSKTSILVGKLLPFYMVNLMQISIMFLIGVIVFGMDLGHIPALILVSLALSATANGMGLFVAAICRTEAQVNGLSVLLAVTLSALGGMMVPTFLMPGFMKSLSFFTPHAWALRGHQDVIIRGLGLGDVLPETGVLLLFAAFFFVIALWRFRFDS